MEYVNIQEARSNLSQLVMKAAGGEPFIITKFGKPMAMISPCGHRPVASVQRVGFMKGKISVPDDFDRLGGEEIQRLFENGQ